MRALSETYSVLLNALGYKYSFGISTHAVTVMWGEDTRDQFPSLLHVHPFRFKDYELADGQRPFAHVEKPEHALCIWTEHVPKLKPPDPAPHLRRRGKQKKKKEKSPEAEVASKL